MRERKGEGSMCKILLTRGNRKYFLMLVILYMPLPSQKWRADKDLERRNEEKMERIFVFRVVFFWGGVEIRISVNM